jgi:hypothetical protein
MDTARNNGQHPGIELSNRNNINSTTETIVLEDSSMLLQRDSSPQEDQPTSIPLLHEPRNNDAAETSSVVGNDNEQGNNKPSLSHALLLSYAIYGFTMSLPSLPTMYILNTRVPLPLSILPTYGALAFLPYSFKPLYALMANGYFCVSRQHGLCMGWFLCALTTIGWTMVPTIPWVFVVGIANGTAMAWSGFLLGLTLLDTARAQQQQGGSSSSTTNNNVNAFEVSASVFQSQAATARNVGSLTASIVTCLVFGVRQQSSSTSGQQSEWSESLVDGLFWATALCHGVSLLLVVFAQEAFAPIVELHKPTTTTPATIATQEGRRSYAALEVYPPEEDEEIVEAARENNDSLPSSICSTTNVIIVVLLQLCILILAMRQPILRGLSENNNRLLLIAAGFVVALISVLCVLACTHGSRVAQRVRCSFGWTHMVGLVLILRHAVPDTSAVLGSFLYHCFESQPVWLQVFSLVDTAMVTMASWLYQSLWAPHYSHGRKLITFMIISTIVTHAMSNIYLLVVRNVQQGESFTANSVFPWMVLGIKAFSSFIMEWNFLPSVVLATVSVSETKEMWSTPDSVTADCDEEETQQTAQPEGIQPVTGNTRTTTRATVLAPSTPTNVIYGSLISCIDFGDQIGAILSTPIITALHITRENNWHNLDRLIVICSCIGMTSATIFLFLLGRLPDKHRIATST